LRLKCTKFDFGWGSAPDPAGGAYSAPQTPSWIWRPLRGRGRGWAGEEEGKGEGKGREREVEGRKRTAPKLLLNHGPSEPCYTTGRVHSTRCYVESNIDRDLVTNVSK